MPSNDEMIVKKESLLDKIKKNTYVYLTKRGLKKVAKVYADLPSYIQSDTESLNILTKKNPLLIDSMPEGIVVDVAKENPNIINYVSDISKLSKILQQQPEMVTSINDENKVYSVCYRHNNKEIVKHLPKDTQKRMLTEQFYYTNERGEESYAGRTAVNMVDFDVVKDIITERKEAGDMSLAIGDSDYRTLSLEQQQELFGLNSKVFDRLSREAKEKIIDGNPLVAEERYKMRDAIDQDFYNEYFTNHPEILKSMPGMIQGQFKYKGVNAAFPSYNPSKHLTAEQLKDDVIEVTVNSMDICNYYDSIEDENLRWEMGKYDPKFVKMYDSYPNRNAEIIERIYNLTPKDSKIAEYIQQNLMVDGKIGYDRRQSKVIDRLTKIMLNEDVVNNVDHDLIMQSAIEPSSESLSQIVETTYGKDAAQILKDRPNVSLDTIPNLHMLSPQIIEEFGIGAVHASLSIKSCVPLEFSEFARNPEKMEEYKKFNRICGSKFEDTIIGLDKKLRSFEISKDLLKGVEEQDISEEMIDNLTLAMQERLNNRTIENNQLIMDFPKTIDELQQYKTKRDAIYDEAISKSSDITTTKNLICKRYFGMRYSGNASEYVDIKDVSVLEMDNFYKLSNFLEAESLPDNISKDDADAMRLLKTITEIKDIDVLKEMAQGLSQNPQVMHPLQYTQLKEKLPQVYTKELVNSLTSPEQLITAYEQGLEGVKVREVDGIKIITLSGQDFTIYATNPFLANNSYIKDSINGSEEKLFDTWNNLEEGVGEFSGCLMNQDELRSTFSEDKPIGLGFCDIDAKQIAAMGMDDIHTSHGFYKLATGSAERGKVQFRYVKEFMEGTTKRLNENPADMHPYNEIAALRRNADLSSIEHGTSGGRIQPNYIYAHGKETGEKGLKLAKTFGCNYIIECDTELYEERIAEYNEKEKQRQEELAKSQEDIIKEDKEEFSINYERKEIDKQDIGEEI